MSGGRAFAALVILTMLAMTAAQAATLRVSPVLLDVRAPQQATSLRVWNDGASAVSVQVRIYRWVQRDGADVLEPTRDVVVSPPIATLQPGEENLVRVVRVSGAPVRAEESYRVLVDELPDPAAVRPGTVALVLRHSIPVFFGDAETQAAVSWRATPEAGGVRLIAANSGGRRLRIANLKLTAGGATLGERQGLVGYVLSGASAEFMIPLGRGGDAGPITVTAESETGRFDAVAQPAGR